MALQFPTTCPNGAHHEAVYLPDKKQVVVINPVRTTEILDLATGQWSHGPELNTPRQALKVVYLQPQGKIYAIGGLGTNIRGLISIEALDVSGNIERSAWTTLLPPYRLHTPRFGHAAVLVMERFLVVMGGFQTAAVEIFDLNPLSAATNVWLTGPPMTKKRAYFGATVVQGNKIVVGGGMEEKQGSAESSEEEEPVIEFDFIEFKQTANNVHELFPQGAQWRTHPTLKLPVSNYGTQLFSLDPRANSFLVMGHWDVKMVDYENSEWVRLPGSSFSVDRYGCAGALLPACQQSHPAGVLAIGGRYSRTSMEWLSLPDAIGVRLVKYQNCKLPEFPSLPPKPTLSSNPEQLKSSLQGWVQEAESILMDYLTNIKQWKDGEENFCQGERNEIQNNMDKLQGEINQLRTQHGRIQQEHDSHISFSTEKAKKYVDRCQLEVASIRGIIEGLGRGNTVADALAGLHYSDPPHALCCPITFQLMKDPVVIVESGHTYERAAIAQHWETQEASNIPITCPNTNQRLDSKQLTPSLLVRSQCREWQQQHPDWHP
eukprot:CAMPEP_0168732632 /NCGR_PEP_ID=MMETSP0724-20121128/7869_1 /TAXON_ID=265536 /ORGANISM="Amphiprora sp., Strain CCMP467" /LENGTH=545 /DNA_ID=CAMNT_0008779653 /DNA_START=199 /DNA_END=1836 /DNA_ORIENTATION=+